MQHDGTWRRWSNDAPWRDKPGPTPGAPEQQDALRQALLQRVVDGLGIAREIEEHGLERLWPAGGPPCCWVSYDFRAPHSGHIERWTYRLCRSDCAHWHHQAEVILA